jgi:hypothetical protein
MKKDLYLHKKIASNHVRRINEVAKKHTSRISNIGHKHVKNINYAANKHVKRISNEANRHIRKFVEVAMLIILPDMSINNIVQRVKESIFLIKNTTKQYVSEVVA